MSNKVNRKFRKLSIEQRIHSLFEAGYLDESEREHWLGQASLDFKTANRMVENVVSVFGLPQGVAINFPVNGKDWVIPMVTEEPSVVAALCYAGLLAEKSGGFRAQYTQPLLTGQIQLIGVDNPETTVSLIDANREAIIAEGNALVPTLIGRGGGVRKVHASKFVGPNSHTVMVVVNLAIDTRDAMGANLVNSLCEGLAPYLEQLTGAQALLKILSNFADEAIASATVSYSPQQLATRGLSGDAVRDRIVIANDLALVDPYRACTHNKGIMNGIDAFAVATGNDWRSIEAAAHAYAARDGRYRALTQWTVDDRGHLQGKIVLPIKVGTVGGSLQANPSVGMNFNLLGVTSASELSMLMAAVGLAQNFAALKALVTTGIQQGHMMLHARSVALSAQVPDQYFDAVVAQLVAEGEIKVRRAEDILKELQNSE